MEVDDGRWAKPLSQPSEPHHQTSAYTTRHPHLPLSPHPYRTSIDSHDASLERMTAVTAQRWRLPRSCSS